MIATQHPVVSEELQMDTCVVVGKQSRIQDGTLVRVLAQPRNKYEGVHLVLGPCRLQRRRACLHEFELVGDVVRTLQTKWNCFVHKAVADANDVPWTQNVPHSFHVGSKRARFFEWHSSNVYKPCTSADIDSDGARGFAVVMTRGPWFHQSKRNVHTAWHLVEWISF
jgi:hypothetical protein